MIYVTNNTRTNQNILHVHNSGKMSLKIRTLQNRSLALSAQNAKQKNKQFNDIIVSYTNNERIRTSIYGTKYPHPLLLEVTAPLLDVIT